MKPMTTQEVAEYLSMSKSALEKMRSRNEGPPYCKAGKLVRYRREDIDKWLMSNREETYG